MTGSIATHDRLVTSACVPACAGRSSKSETGRRREWTPDDGKNLAKPISRADRKCPLRHGGPGAILTA